MRFENLVIYDMSKTFAELWGQGFVFENLVIYDMSKTILPLVFKLVSFENLVIYDMSKTKKGGRKDAKCV